MPYSPRTALNRAPLEAALDKDGTMRLAVNGGIPVTGKAPGLIPRQPQDELSLGEDTQTAVGNYTPPHPLKGKVENVSVIATP